jgi:hypothetical protein
MTARCFFGSGLEADEQHVCFSRGYLIGHLWSYLLFVVRYLSIRTALLEQYMSDVFRLVYDRA